MAPVTDLVLQACGELHGQIPAAAHSETSESGQGRYLDVALVCFPQLLLLGAQINGMHGPALHDVHHVLHLQHTLTLARLHSMHEQPQCWAPAGLRRQ